MSLRLSSSLLLLAAAPLASLLAADPPTNAELQQKIDELDQQIRILGRKAEITAEESEAKSKTNAKVFANSKDGFGISSADGLYKIRFRALLQADARIFIADPESDPAAALPANTQVELSNQFLVRAFRLPIEAQLGPVVNAVLVPEFAGNYGATSGNNYRTFVVNEGYLDAKAIPGATLRVGKFVPLVGQDRIQSTSALQLPERSLHTNLTSDREVGYQVYGVFGNGAFGYAASLTNGNPDNSAREGEGTAFGLPTGDDKEGAVNVWVDAFKAIDKDSASTLTVGFAGSYGNEEGAVGTANLPSYRSPGQQTIFTYTAATTFADGKHQRLDPYFRLYSGAVSLLGEYIRTKNEVGTAATTEALTHTGWYLQSGWVVTGEDASWRGVSPRVDFDPSAGGWGALELVARVHRIDFDDAAFDPANGFASDRSSVRSATAVGVGANWFWSRNVKVSGSYDTTKFKEGAGNGAAPASEDRATEHVVVSRFQVAF